MLRAVSADHLIGAGGRRRRACIPFNKAEMARLIATTLAES